MKDIVVIYHAQCRDGFGAAYAAWKKFGDSASYVPCKTQDPVPEGIEGKELYILDYSYKMDQLEDLVRKNKSVVVIDHHKTAEDTVKAFPGNVFDLEHSGAVLAWEYFHPQDEVPKLLLYIEDQDLWRMSLPNHREFGAALGEYTQDFATWDQLAKNLEDKAHLDVFLNHGSIISNYENRYVNNLLTFRERVTCEGYEVYAVNCARIYRSVVGNRLAALNAREGRDPFGIVYYRYDGMWHCSLRSLDGFDVSSIAKKYGGGGHPGASSLRVEKFEDLPFTFTEQN